MKKVRGPLKKRKKPASVKKVKKMPQPIHSMVLLVEHTSTNAARVLPDDVLHEVVFKTGQHLVNVWRKIHEAGIASILGFNPHSFPPTQESNPEFEDWICENADHYRLVANYWREACNEYLRRAGVGVEGGLARTELGSHPITRLRDVLQNRPDTAYFKNRTNKATKVKDVLDMAGIPHDKNISCVENFQRYLLSLYKDKECKFTPGFERKPPFWWKWDLPGNSTYTDANVNAVFKEYF